MAFVTLVAGASATEDELLSFAAQRVDEALARPKRVVIIDRMPMTNVGKIYKPELRILAARTVVVSLVRDACRALDVREDAWPKVDTHPESGVTVRLDMLALGASTAPLREQLHAMLTRLPIKTQLHCDKDMS